MNEVFVRPCSPLTKTQRVNDPCLSLSLRGYRTPGSEERPLEHLEAELEAVSRKTHDASGQLVLISQELLRKER